MSGWINISNHFIGSYAINLTDNKWDIDNTGGNNAGDKINYALEEAYDLGIRKVFVPAGTYLYVEFVCHNNNWQYKLIK